MTEKEALKILNLKENFTEKELKTAYRTLSKKYHPDVNKEPGAEAKFKNVGAAYAFLKNSEIQPNQPKRKTYDEQDDLSIFKIKILENMWEMVDLKEIESFLYSYLWLDYIHKMYGIHDSYYDKIKESFTKEKIEQLKKEFEEEFYDRMNHFDDYFLGIHPYFKNKKKKPFKTVEEQLEFYKKLMEEIPEKVSEIVIPLIENTVEYKVAKNLLNIREDYFNSIIIKKLKEELVKEKHFIKSLKEMAIEIIASEIKEKRDGKTILHILSFIRKAESLSLLYNYIGSFSTKDGIESFLLDKVIRLSTQREAYANKKQGLKLCQDIVFDKDFYLNRIWDHMSSFLGELIREKDFAKNQDVYNKFGQYPLEIIALAKNEIISVDTLMQVEDALCGNYDAERMLKVLEYALNITDDIIINPDYLFISIEENIENPLAVLHRGERNYEIFSENELGRIEKEEINNARRGAIMGYIPIRKVFFNADFIGKRIGNLDIICCYEGLYLTMDIYGNIKFCKEEQINKAEFTDGNESLRDPEAILKILCDKANVKYASQLNGKNGKWLYYK